MQAKTHVRVAYCKKMAIFSNEDAHILTLLGNALPTPVFDGGEGGISFIQVLERDTKSSFNAMAYAVYTLICWVREGKIGGLPRTPTMQGIQGDPGSTGPRGPLGPPGHQGVSRPQGVEGARGPVGPRIEAESEGRTEPSGGGHSMLRWNKVLKSLSWEHVRPWVTKFTIFLRNVEMTEGQAKVLLLQHVEGLVLAFTEALLDNNNVLTCLDQLLQYVTPS